MFLNISCYHVVHINIDTNIKAIIIIHTALACFKTKFLYVRILQYVTNCLQQTS